MERYLIRRPMPVRYMQEPKTTQGLLYFVYLMTKEMATAVMVDVKEKVCVTSPAAVGDSFWTTRR